LFSSIRARLRGASDATGPAPRSSAEPVADGNPLPDVEVRALGSPQITVDGRKVGAVEWESQKAQELFAFLLCNRQGKSREELIEVLWPDISVNLSRNAFHNNVYRTRRALYRGCVVLDEGRYLLQPQGAFWFDLDEFRRLSREAELAKACSKKQVTLLSQANRLYRGEFLRGMEAEWITPIRMEAEGLYLSNLARLADASAKRGDYPSTVAALDQVLNVDPRVVETHEPIVQLLVGLASRGRADIAGCRRARGCARPWRRPASSADRRLLRGPGRGRRRKPQVLGLSPAARRPPA
jgi:two-component SAPR family response regulator